MSKARTTGRDKEQGRKGNALLSLPWPYLLAGLAVLGFSLYLRFGDTADAQRSEVALAQAQQLAGQLRDPIIEIRNLVTNPDVLAHAQRALDDQALESELLAFLRAQMSAVVDVHVYDTRVFMLDLDEAGDHGYILLDMMATADTDSVAPVQVIQPAGDLLLTSAAAISSGEDVLGYIVVFVEPDSLLERFTPGEPAAEYIALEHRTGANTPFQLTAVGKSVPLGFNLHRVPVPASLFQIVVPQAVNALPLSPRDLNLLTTMGLLLLLAGVYRIGLNVRAKRARRAEIDAYEPPPTLVQRASQEAAREQESLAAHRQENSSQRSAEKGGGDAPQAEKVPADDGENPMAPVAAPSPGRSRKKTSQGSGVESVKLSSGIFRAYDIRGVVGESLDRGVARQVGQAVGSLVRDMLAGPVVVGRDGRHSGPDLVAGMIEGIRAAGCDVIDVGAVPTGVLYYACYELANGSGVMVTGSHNPPDYNGFKIMVGGKTLSGDMIMGLFERISSGNLRSGEGALSEQQVIPAYIERVASDIKLERPLKVVADCGNGIGGACAADLLRAIGAEVVPLFDEVDGDFPNHHPDPSEPENMSDLIEAVRLMEADLGVAFDGDADRLGVVTRDGEIVFADRIMMLYCQEVLSRNPGSTIIYDVKCTGHLARIISEAGGVPEMYKTGHSLIKNRMKEVNAPFAGEMSGHFFFTDRWYGFDCGLYSAARLLEILARDKRSPTDVLNSLPNSVSTPELKAHLAEGENHSFIQKFQASASFEGAEINTIDGVRADFDDGWGLVRASNTTPILVLRFDADNVDALKRIQEAFRAQLLAIKPDMKLPF